MEYDVGIRVDMGGKIGSGHYFRCLAIAQQLQKQKKKVIFLVKNKTELLKHENKKIQYIQLEKGSEQIRIRHCKKLADRIKLFIIDLPAYSELYAKELKADNKIIIFDDVGNKKLDCDIIINGTIVKKFQKYNIKNQNTKVCLGSKYLILRNQFYKTKKNYNVSISIKKIVVTFGGNDEKNYSYKITKFLCQNGYNVTVILGPTYKKNKRILDLSKKFLNLQIRQNVKNISKLFITQDLVICSVGITVYELACLGVPCIMIPDTKLQNIMANEIQKQGFGINFGKLENNLEELRKNLSKLEPTDKRKKISKKGKKMIDGKGLSRVVKILLSLT
jgi:UDP-2,4-diacetamido-2,4,6-trideoxy-beta-L-altropyranose hydrolase